MLVAAMRSRSRAIGITILVAALGVVRLALADTTSANTGGQCTEGRVISVYGLAASSVVDITRLGYVYDFFFFGVIPQEGSGSGFIYDAQGHILTNYHVVQIAQELVVAPSAGERFPAVIAGTAPSSDVAVLELATSEDSLPSPLEAAGSDPSLVGPFVVSIGAPFGLRQTLTTGVVSAVGRVIVGPAANRFIGEGIQTDAAINPGSLGEPLLNLDGKIIGYNSRIPSTSGSYAGIGAAISSNTVARVVPELISNGKHRHQRSPVGVDTIGGVDGVPVEDLGDLTIDLELEKRPGDLAELKVIRGTGELSIPVLLVNAHQVLDAGDGLQE